MNQAFTLFPWRSHIPTGATSESLAKAALTARSFSYGWDTRETIPISTCHVSALAAARVPSGLESLPDCANLVEASALLDSTPSGETKMVQLAICLLVMIGGTSFVIQQAVNADLRTTLDSSAWAGFVSYVGGALCMLALASGLRSPFPSISTWSAVHWFDWTGGLFGAIYIAISILLVRSMGAAAFVALIVTGQMISALLIDHYGLLGMAQSAVSLQRLIGAALLIVGVILVRS